MDKIIDAIINWDFWMLLATATIPLALHNYSRTSTTMNAINELRQKWTIKWQAITDIPKEFDNITPVQRHLIMDYLNEYDHFCTLYNEGLIKKSIVKKTRKTTIKNAFNIHKSFITRWREEYDAEAWINLELCASKI
ncbi:DUF4760 domain-containing protein [Neptunomonas phycophila]|uniref:DUF4760 domain-containing protein n=1 Tax=Neptunomonas phycophila TaxID=1572645 RepID=UPI000948F147|nr:hypothetical protein [Neptunomonas phycophila]